jgi:hypothetical protein
MPSKSVSRPTLGFRNSRTGNRGVLTNRQRSLVRTQCNVLGLLVSGLDRNLSYFDSWQHLRQMTIITKQSRGNYVYAGAAASFLGG